MSKQLHTRLKRILDKVRGHTMTSREKEEQRRSFAYGNVALHNPEITHEDIDRAAEELAKENY
jgi:hypothetical protein